MEFRKLCVKLSMKPVKHTCRCQMPRDWTRTRKMSSSTNKSDYSDQLEQYRQSGNICAFLNITFDKNESAIFDELTGKFDAFDAAGFHLSSSSFLELLIPSILRQFTVARCSYEYQLTTIEDYKIRRAERDALGYVNPVFPLLVVPSAMAMLDVLFNISLLVVTARKISMSTVCNWLLAFDSFCQIPALLPNLINLFALCARFDSVDYRLCLASLMLSTGSSYASFLAVYFMSLERVLIAMRPMRMSQMSEKTVRRCSLLAVFVCLIFGVAMILTVFNVRMDTNMFISFYVYINIGFNQYSMSIYGISHAILGLALFNYVLIAGLISWRRIYLPRTQADLINNAAYSQATNRLLCSVFSISIVLAIGWLIGTVLLFPITEAYRELMKIIKVLFAIPVEDSDRFGNNLFIWLISPIVCLFPVAAGINAPVMIINNDDYREAYKKMVTPLLICRRRTVTAVVGPLFINHHHQ